MHNLQHSGRAVRSCGSSAWSFQSITIRTAWSRVATPTEPVGGAPWLLAVRDDPLWVKVDEWVNRLRPWDLVVTLIVSPGLGLVSLAGPVLYNRSGAYRGLLRESIERI